MAKLTPYDWQLRDQETLRRSNYTGLVGIEAGGGKSLTAALAIAEARPEVTLIIAPKSTHETAWIPTLRDNADVTPRIIGNGSKAEKAAMIDFELGMPGAYLVTPQLVTRMDVSGWRGDMLVIDEIHMAAVTPKSKAQRKISGYYPTDGEPLNRRFPMRLALSATPARGDFTNMWGVTRFLWPHLDRPGQIADSNLYRWQMERMDYKTVYTGQRDRNGNVKTVKDYYGETVPGRLMREMPCVIMHKRRETCCDAHPGGFLTTDEPQVIEREVVLTATQKRNIREMNDLMMTYIEDNPLEATISLTQKQRIRQLAMAEAQVETYDGFDAEGDPVEKSRVIFSPDAKSPIINEIRHIIDNLPEKEAVLIFSDSQKFAELITHQLNASGVTAEEYSGVRKADLTKFGETYRVLVGVTSAIGTGTNGLQKNCSTEIYADQPISLTMQTQSSARLDRMDSQRRVQRYVILDDEGIAKGRMEDLWAQKVAMEKSMRRG